MLAYRVVPAHRTASYGLFTLANDGVLDWAIALFESVRELAPELPLQVIPYDDRQSALAPVVERFGFSYCASEEADRLHEIGRRFYPGNDFAARGFRKLAAFRGPFARFLFLDADVVALSPLGRLLADVDRSGADLVHFDTDLDQVYRPGAERDRFVAAGARGFNCGLFAGRRGAVPVDDFDRILTELGPSWSERLVPNAEQPFLNFFADRARLNVIPAHELAPGHCSTCWAAVGRIALEDGVYRLRGTGRWDEGWRLYCAHWAGFPLGPEIPNRELWERFHSAGAERAAVPL
jgi:hypothetical protein